MRVFIAIEFSDTIKKYLFDKQQLARKYCTKGNFTSSANFHLTLRFIGEVQNNELSSIKKAIDDTAELNNPFEISFDSIGCFSRGFKKILWIGIQKSNELQNLYTCLEDALSKYGYIKDEKGYSPHITLGREVVTDNMESLKNEIEIKSEKINVTGISLMESTRVNGILTYRPLYQGKLKAAVF